MGGSFWTSTWAIIIYVVVGLALIIGMASLGVSDPGAKTRSRVEAYAQHEEAKVAWATCTDYYGIPGCKGHCKKCNKKCFNKKFILSEGE
ncbi:uncharacterized protein FIESC28_08495 [Fusarium coffeatum]|uniref:Uncharacterized protein n=1 Tax=Fusarium coffeatum TaxID=231269 RepID=A0A366R6N7_9HYPO|nr:uncharacterized protein FIESC28_08495 [Fusarium coffeatum]RBR12793.1 hypothetical protein FIESC28_08495 [Fusarium coffeatum]